MSFLKKIFGSKENKEENGPVENGSILDAYKKIPWMTDERLNNISLCLKLGYKPASSLPTEFERQLRPKIEIAKRLNAIKAMVLWLLVPEEDLEDQKILNFVDQNELKVFMTEDEVAIFKLSREDDEARNLIGWKFENAWPLAWYFGYSEPEVMGHMMTGEAMQDILFNYSCSVDDKVEDWVEERNVISEKELIHKEDLFYCLHNTVRSAQLGGETVPDYFDPMVNGGVIHERRHALTWMLSKGTSWEETDLSS